jgi:predicted CoA-binding protein
MHRNDDYARGTPGRVPDAAPFRNPDQHAIRALLQQARTIAIVGLSDDPHRPSYGVARGLQTFGYRIVPVNPALDSVWGERAIPDLDHLGDVLGPGERVDIVDVFRAPEHVDAIVDDCIRLRVPALWLQEGVVNAAAARRAEDAGILVVMDRCIFKTRASLKSF